MKNDNRHPAAHSGAPLTPYTGEGSHIPRGQAATSDMKVDKPAQHPAPGCTPKLAGHVQPTEPECITEPRA